MQEETGGGLSSRKGAGGRGVQVAWSDEWGRKKASRLRVGYSSGIMKEGEFGTRAN